MNQVIQKTSLFFIVLLLATSIKTLSQSTSTPDSITITFDANGGSLSPSVIRCNYNDVPARPPFPQRKGYTFMGWYPARYSGSRYDFDFPLLRSMTFYARWTFDILFMYNGGLFGGFFDNNVGIHQYVEIDSLVIEPPARFITKAGYVFGGWYTDTAFQDRYTFSSPPTSSFSLYAKWILPPVTVSFNPNNGTSIPPVTIPHNTTLTAPQEPQKDGYTFVGWYKDIYLFTQHDFSSPIIQNSILYAKWVSDQVFLDSIYKLIYVYPNPASSGNVTVQWDGSIKSLIREVSLSPITLSGNTLVSSVAPSANENKVAFNIDNLSPGLYLLECRLTNGKIVRFKWIKN